MVLNEICGPNTQAVDINNEIMQDDDIYLGDSMHYFAVRKTSWPSEKLQASHILKYGRSEYYTIHSLIGVSCFFKSNIDTRVQELKDLLAEYMIKNNICYFLSTGYMNKKDINKHLYFYDNNSFALTTHDYNFSIYDTERNIWFFAKNNHVPLL